MSTTTTTTTTTPLTRTLVAKAVDAYGVAWTTQDPDKIANLFTASAIYVERPFDTGATMRGNDAIRQYWTTQIVGKQSNIRFRHVASEMVLDVEKNTAVVKWLAEFDNIRFKMDTEHKRVKFCQMAKLIFNADCTKIQYLEEYAQSTTSARYKWPVSINTATDAQLWEMVRNERECYLLLFRQLTGIQGD